MTQAVVETIMATDNMDVDVQETNDMKIDADNDDDIKIDESLYNRQLYVIDAESMKKLIQNKVLICGMNGLGVEIAKNIILAGVKQVTILDNKLTKINDLGSNFYLTKDDVGKKRSVSCLNKLKELNPYVKVNVIETELTDELINSNTYQCIVLVNYCLSDQIKINKLCHKNNIKFISTNIHGLFGNIFVDFGDKFEISDTNGENPKSGIVTHISKGKPGVVTVHEDQRHGLETGDFVIFEEVEGMTGINGQKPMVIKVKSPFTFEIQDTSSFDEYKANGMYYQVKQGSMISMKTLEEENKKPSLNYTDFGKEPMIHHIFYNALNEFYEKNKKYPDPTSLKDAQSVVDIAIKLAFAMNLNNSSQNNNSNNNENTDVTDGDTSNGNNEVLSKEIQGKLLNLARIGGSVISPMAAFLGGVVGQEILKACSGKFTPLKQFLYYDAIECLPNIKNMDLMKEFKSTDSRYDDYINIFGQTIMNKVLNSKMFLVGSGAIGCEMLKNWALMGIACGANGSITITDMDNIELSNLNRQFLFRKKDIGAPKSRTAGKAIKAMNKDIKIIAQEYCVGKDTETVYNDTFWSELDCVCNALDNVKARLYVDGKCIQYKRPLMESGTLGTKGNTQIIVPCLTESYGSQVDPPEESVPLCTLKNFPYKIEHTIQWAKDEFLNSFNLNPNNVNSYIGDSEYVTELLKSGTNQIEILSDVLNNLTIDKATKLENCVEWARNKFEHDYNYKIKQLLYNFPSDHINEDGQMFWSGVKRAPKPIDFDATNDIHLQYIVSASNLRANVYSLKPTKDVNTIINILKTIKVKKYEIKKNIKIKVKDDDNNDDTNTETKIEPDFEDKIKDIKIKLPNRKDLVGYKLNSIEFDKDNDSNYHIDFITSCSNLRAINYRIKTANKFDTKKIAGKIIPAIATTTALVTGLICLEYYKLLQNINDITLYRSSNCNLALPFITMFEPNPTPKASIMKKGGKFEYTLWDKIDIKNAKDMTPIDLIKYFDKQWGMELNLITFGDAILYAFYMNPKKLMMRKKLKIKKLIEAVTKKKLPKGTKYLNLEVSVDYIDDDSIEVELPTICLHI